MGFGWPTRYWQLDIGRVPMGAQAWDRAVHEASEEYKQHAVGEREEEMKLKEVIAAQFVLRQLPLARSAGVEHDAVQRWK